LRKYNEVPLVQQCSGGKPEGLPVRRFNQTTGGEKDSIRTDDRQEYIAAC
jgi:hypothetical protein